MSTSIKIINQKEEEVGDIKVSVDLNVFKSNIATVYKVVNSILSNSTRLRFGHYKNVKGLAGSGRKLRRQKRTGRARVGAARSISTRGGAVKFGFTGDKATDLHKRYRRYKKINTKEALNATVSIIANRYRTNSLFVIKSFIDFDSTKNASKFIDKFTGTNIIVYSSKKDVINFGNLQKVELCNIDSFNALRAVSRKNIIFDSDAASKFFKNVNQSLKIVKTS